MYFRIWNKNQTIRFKRKVGLRSIFYCKSSKSRKILRYSNGSIIKVWNLLKYTYILDSKAKLIYQLRCNF